MMNGLGRSIRTGLAVIAVALAAAATAAGQGRITTRKFRISDFTERVTKVVLSGNAMMDSAWKQEVTERWTASPFEFCSQEEFAALKSSEKYYFLLIASGQEGDGDGLRFLTLLKGGKPEGLKSRKDAGQPAAPDRLDDMTFVASVPLGPDGAPGREWIFMPALLDILQDYVLLAMDSEWNAYTGLSVFNANYEKYGHHKRICLSLGDLAPQVRAVQLGRLDEDILLTEEDEADRMFQQGTFNTLVSFTVAPRDPQPGDSCYKMLIDADTHRLYYFKRHKITDKQGPGFLPKDLRVLSRGR